MKLEIENGHMYLIGPRDEVKKYLIAAPRSSSHQSSLIMFYMHLAWVKEYKKKHPIRYFFWNLKSRIKEHINAIRTIRPSEESST